MLNICTRGRLYGKLDPYEIEKHRGIFAQETFLLLKPQIDKIKINNNKFYPCAVLGYPNSKR